MNSLLRSTLLLAFSLMNISAYGATATNSFQVTTTVTTSCSVSASDLGFGSINPISNTAATASTSVSVTCTNGTSYNLGLNEGTGTGASVSARKLTSGANTVTYSLYQDSAHTTVWGNTVGTDTLAGTGTGSAQSITVYGKVPTGYNAAPAGTYTDTITVTVTY